MAKQLQVQAEHDENFEQAIASVERLAGLDDSGWLQLIELIDVSGERSWLSDEVRHQLSGKLQEWRELSPDKSAAKVQRLAARLRTRSEHWRDDTTQFSGQLARTMLRWPIPQGMNKGDLVGDCEFLIYRSANLPATSELTRNMNELNSEEAQGPTPIEDEFPIPAPVGDFRPPARDGVLAETKTVDVTGLNRGVIGTSPGKMTADTRPLLRRSDREVVEQLTNDDFKQVLIAESELRNRGYSQAEIDLAEKVVDPNFAVRQSVVEQLTHLRNVDTKRWLLWMARDPNREVRYKAIMTLSTLLNSDSQVKEELRRLQVNEPDRLIRESLTRVINLHDQMSR
ncbi:MAG: HEAT repeat domain-containing protein [Pirellulaceae bacterium]